MSKKVLAALLAVCMVASLLFVPAAAASTFTDVDEDHWASGAIERWAGYGVLNGKDAEAGIFDPSAPMTRAEFAKMLVEMLGLTAKSEATFDDVDPEAWYADVVSIAVKAGIISGRPGNKFDPTAPVTFEEAAVMMCRAFGLAQVTSGAEWAKESIEKLTSLGMIGEGADEHLQVGVDCDRAVVAALADAVVKEYVNEDREEPITGEVNGVVLVVKGAKVEIKDATVSAPIVVESAEVTLTGTKAEDVKVSGKDAAIVADEASTVASVTLAGEAPKADIKGEVASVTIAEETTGAVVDAPKADPDTIVNNSTEEATVNGETVEGKPAETTDPTEPEGPGSVNGNDGPEAPPRGGTSGGDAVEDDRNDVEVGTPPAKDTADVPESGDITDDDINSDGKDTTSCGSGHTWDDGNVTKVASCGEAGSVTYTCTVCGSTATKAITALSHKYYVSAVEDPTCTADGEKTETCVNCGDVKTTVIDAKGHEFATSDRYGYNATQHWKICKYCNQADETKENHNCDSWTDAENGRTHTGTCDCGATVTENHTMPDTWTSDGADTHSKTCTATGCGYKVTENHTWTDKADDATKEVCACGAERTKPVTPENCAQKEGHAALHEGVHCEGCTYVGVAAHQWQDVANSDTATCTAAGKKDQSCSCGATQKVDTQALGHNPADLSTICPGQECSRCHAPGTGSHTWTDSDPAGTKCNNCSATKPDA